MAFQFTAQPDAQPPMLMFGSTASRAFYCTLKHGSRAPAETQTFRVVLHSSLHTPAAAIQLHGKTPTAAL